MNESIPLESVIKVKTLSKFLVTWLEDHQTQFQIVGALEPNAMDALELACLLLEEVGRSKVKKFDLQKISLLKDVPHFQREKQNDLITKKCYNIPILTDGGAVKTNEFKRWLAKKGATFAEGSRHTKVYLNGNQTTLPRHGGKELGNGLIRAICKQLDIECPI